MDGGLWAFDLISNRWLLKKEEKLCFWVFKIIFKICKKIVKIYNHDFKI